MAAQWLLYEVSNIGLTEFGNVDMRHLYRKQQVFDDFNEAKSRMKNSIQAYTSQECLFDSYRDLKGLDDLCDLFLDDQIGVCKPGEYYLEDELDNESKEFITSLPAILKDYFIGKEDLHLVFSKFVDVNAPFILTVKADFSYEEMDASIELGNIDSLNIDKKDDKIDAPYLTPATNLDALPPRFSINSFNMDDPNLNYFCRVTGEYNVYDVAAPFFHIELVKIAE